MQPLGAALLPVKMVDMSLLPLTVVGEEDGEDTLGMFGLEDAKTVQEGATYTITYKDDQMPYIVISRSLSWVASLCSFLASSLHFASRYSSAARRISRMSLSLDCDQLRQSTPCSYSFSISV